MRAHLLLLVASATLLSFVGCGGPYSPSRRAHSIQQLTPGQTMLAAAPVQDQPREARLTLGFGAGGGLGGVGEEGAELHTPTSIGHGDMALRAGKVELSAVFDTALSDSSDGIHGVSPKGATMQYGGRFRASPGTGRFHVGMSFELGMRHYQTQLSVSCYGENGYDAQNCVADHDVINVEYARPYFATTIYPTVRVGQHLYLFAGFGFDTGMMTSAEDEPYENVGPDDRAALKPNFSADLDMVGYATFGVDLRISDRFAALATFREVGGDEDNMTDFSSGIFEAGVSLIF
ncbi:hypothetical protein KKF91_19970 [Myxococcota bacterium]|nr:hypothetical protein [Myxococcota bacterium]MBU1432823.1 hypothetical protein [Myxococcota bacterium]MBU1897551.1 hypothetical protein [Myxococcota bacterium]